MPLKRFVRDDLEWMLNSTREGRKAWERLAKERESYLVKKKATLADLSQTRKQRDAQAETLDKMVLGVDAQIKAHKEKTEQAYKRIWDEYAAGVSDLYMPSGKALDSETVALLSSGISLTDTEVSTLVSRYAQNPTMLRLIWNYVEKNGNKVSYDQMAIMIRSTTAGEDELKTFKDIWNVCRWCAEGSGLYPLDATESMIADAKQKLTGYPTLCDGGNSGNSGNGGE